MQQHGSKQFVHRPTLPTLGVGSKGHSSTFSEYGHVSYQIKGNVACSNMVANILPANPHPFPTLRVGSKGQNSTFSEHGHVAYQINWNHECSNMVAHILPADPPPTLGCGQNSAFFQNMVMLHIKLRELACSNVEANIFLQTPPSPTLGARSKFNFFRTWPCCISIPLKEPFALKNSETVYFTSIFLHGVFRILPSLITSI